MQYTPPPSGGGVGTLQTVTDAGNTTSNQINVNNNINVVSGDVIIRSNSGNSQLTIQQGIGASQAANLRWQASQTRAHLVLYREVGINTGSTILAPTNSSGSITIELPAIAGTLAPYTDPNGNLNYAGFFINAASNVWGSLAYDGVEGALELVNAAGFVSNLKTLATSARLNTLPDEDGTLAIKKYFEAQLEIQRDAGGNVAFNTIYNDSTITFTGSSPAANIIRITPSVTLSNALLMSSSGLEFIAGTVLIETNPFFNSPDIDITHTISATGIVKIQLNIKMII